MLLTPIVVGVMWRALLDPDWGVVNWGTWSPWGSTHRTGWARREWAIRTLILVDVWQWTPFVLLIVYARLQGLPD